MTTKEIWIAEYLPDGTLIATFGAGLVYHDGVIHGWTGRDCPKCSGTGEDFSTENAPHTTCRACAGTAEEHGPLWKVEE